MKVEPVIGNTRSTAAGLRLTGRVHGSAMASVVAVSLMQSAESGPSGGAVISMVNRDVDLPRRD